MRWPSPAPTGQRLRAPQRISGSPDLSLLSLFLYKTENLPHWTRSTRHIVCILGGTMLASVWNEWPPCPACLSFNPHKRWELCVVVGRGVGDTDDTRHHPEHTQKGKETSVILQNSFLFQESKSHKISPVCDSNRLVCFLHARLGSKHFPQISSFNLQQSCKIGTIVPSVYR